MSKQSFYPRIRAAVLRELTKEERMHDESGLDALFTVCATILGATLLLVAVVAVGVWVTGGVK